jgi:hypothetical protein
MGVKAHPSQSAAALEHIPPLNESQKAAVVRALEDIRNSKAFRPSKRCKQFLSYIVERTLEGQGELLKERTLGVEVFHRPPTYMTAEDSVVRVEAGEVRRRLGQYYTTEAQSPEVRIEIPLGSYTPEFHWGRTETRPRVTKKAGFPAALGSHLLTIFLTALVMTGVFAFVSRQKPAQPPSALDMLWAPAFWSPHPVLICLPSPVVYQPSRDLYMQTAQTRPGASQPSEGWWGGPLNLDPNALVPWKDMVPHPNMYVAVEDSYAADQILKVLVRIEKPSQVKSSAGISMRDLRYSPTVLIGAFSNRWTLDLASNLPFSFEKGEFQSIREHSPPGRFWRPQYLGDGNCSRDYAIAARLANSSTGQAVFIAAGIETAGTEAAAEFLSGPKYLNPVFRSAPPVWQHKNFEVVLQTDVTDGVAGPPQIVATRFW